MFDPPLSPVTEVVAVLGLAIVPVPETNVQVPVPTTGILAYMLMEEAQIAESIPAFEVVGKGSTVIKILEEVSEFKQPRVEETTLLK